MVTEVRSPLTLLGFPLGHPLDYANRHVFSDSSYMAEYFTTHRDFYLHVEETFGSGLFFVRM
jgi:hypothetical protein